VRLSIRLAMRGTAPRVIVRGVLDRASAGQLAEYLDTVVSTFAGTIELDLRGIRRIDPTGVALLVRLQRRLRARVAILPSEAVARTVHFVAEGERNRREHGGGASTQRA